MLGELCPVFTSLTHGWGQKQFVDAFLCIRKQKKSLRALVTVLVGVIEGEGCAEARLGRDLAP